MIKKILILVLGLLGFQAAKAQKDTLLYYMKGQYQIVPDKKDAEYFLLIMPVDTSNGKYLYPINEYYPNGKTKLLGYSSSQRFDNLLFEGNCVSFYRNGARKSVINYSHGMASGDIILYYPNKKLYAIESANNRTLLVECRDSTGKVLAENGNGNWIRYDDNLTKEIEEGPVKDSLEEGEWHEIINDSAKFVTVYHKGVAISSTDPYRPIGDKLFAAVEKEPEYPGGIAAFYHDLQRVLVYPAVDRENNVSGRVTVTFVVEKDGSLTGMHAVTEPSKTLGDASVTAIKKLRAWIPGMQGGRPVRVQFTVPVSFNIANR